ncbi:hypothetical protein LD125_00215 [Mesoplasma sp. JKS002658]|nr:hypothetical protein [Mesoplasma sp. JKS002664]MCL8211935.1 hypothetical protein [Mesoplasma sp. JKS002662]MCL8213081.1 hypothetical protein [Mesoplasma sp. JKS002661]MCL8213846.1 hypothetical protein [Mesoplasma sp. JKS002658]MCL8215086.1 hypothetical protein [Mesoplasma sp. JKS002663]MCL8215165.1 hypothetical protein [Mesoplasma sp. JKS002659]MCL8216419.1 hypothetical protein [Mesoplasma sp. JKS002657]
MDESLMKQCRVSDEGLRIVKLCCKGRISQEGNVLVMTVPYQKAPANYVPAAAVIHRGQALSGFIGRTGCVGGCVSLRLKSRAQLWFALKTIRLECDRGKRNSMCSGEMRRYMEEHLWRKRFTGSLLTLRHESVGSK